MCTAAAMVSACGATEVPDAAEDAAAQKRALKLAMRQWEREFEEANGGLVATHDDKKHDTRYSQLKQQGKQLEHQSRKSLGHSRKDVTVQPSQKQLVPSAADHHHHAHAPHAHEHPLRPPVGGGRLALAPGTLYAPDAGGGTLDGAGGAGDFDFVDAHLSISLFHVVALLLCCAVPYALFIASFSLFGFGALIFDYLVSAGEYFYPLIYSAMALLVLLYVFDVSYWESPHGVLARRVLLSVFASFLVLGGALSSKEYPYAPLLLYLFLAPGFFWLLKARLFPYWPLPDFLRALCRALCLLSLAASVVWMVWVVSFGNYWNTANKRRWMLQMGGDCCADLAALPERLRDGGYPGASVMVGESDVLSHLNLTAAVSTSSLWDGLRWPAASANVEHVVAQSPIRGDKIGYTGARYTDGLLYGAAVDETGCLVRPPRHSHTHSAPRSVHSARRAPLRSLRRARACRRCCRSGRASPSSSSGSRRL